MLIPIVPIGNSKGIRIPKILLEQLNIKEKVDLEVEKGQIVLRPIENTPRIGWEKAFQTMAANKDDTLLIEDDLLPRGVDWEW